MKSNQKSHPKEECTLIILKPDAIQRVLIGEIIQRYERVGLKLVAMKMVVASRDHVEKHYTLDPMWRTVTGQKTIKSYLEKGLTPPSNDPLKITEILLTRLAEYMTAGPIIVMVWQGAHAVKLVRKLTGSTEPLTSDVGTIRGDYVLDSYSMSDDDGRAVRNLVHASGSVKEAEDEIRHWFNESEIVKYNAIPEQIFYNVDLGSILGK